MALGTINLYHSIESAIYARQAWLEGNTWGTVLNSALSIVQGIAASLDFLTAVSVLKIPPTPPFGLALAGAGEGGILQAMVLNPAFEAWVITHIMPVVATGIATSGLIFATRHELNWQIRGSNGRFKQTGSETSGSATGSSWPAQAASHTERKFIAKYGDKVNKGEIVTMQGELPMCRPGNPASPFGTGQGCQIHMQWFAKVKEVTVYYVDKLGQVLKIRPNGELVKPDGTIVPTPVSAPIGFGT